MNETEHPIWVGAVADNKFPSIDTALRGGAHISRDHGEDFIYVSNYLEELSAFYQRYGAELIKGPGSYYYLRLRPNALIGRKLLAPFDLLIGKGLCALYISAEQLKGSGIWNGEDLFNKLTSLIAKERILRFQFPRAKGSEADMEKLRERIRSSLMKFKRLRMVAYFGERIAAEEERAAPLKRSFKIEESILRFAIDAVEPAVIDPLADKLIEEGEISHEIDTLGDGHDR